jgi:DNA-binding SARP family transcriptional activator/TolB-like protein
MLVLRTFGTVHVSTIEGTLLDGVAAQKRVLALMSVLAAAGDDGLSRDQVLGLLWPDGDPDKSRHALTQTLYHIRKALGVDDAFLLSGSDVRLNPARITSDVAKFRAHLAAARDEEAIAEYHGPFLDGFVLPDASEFEHWTSVRRTALESAAASALDRLAAAAEARQGWNTAVLWRKRQVAIDRYNASVTAKLMHALLATGDRAGALQQARIHETLMREDLELNADPIVAELAERIRATRTSSPARGVATAAPRVATITQASDTPARSSSWAISAGASPRRSVVGALAATIAFAVVGGIAAHSTRSASAISAADRQHVVVSPFRVAGADPAFAYLREGMVELMSTRLADDSVTVAIDPGAVLNSWRKGSASGTHDVARDAALTMGRDLHGELVVIGSVVGNTHRLVINASLVGAADGVVRADVTVEGPADSLAVLVDRLTGKLLAANAGEGEALADRTSLSLPALRAFLSAQSAYRRGSYLAAIPFYEETLAHDSTFALAALNLALAADRVNVGEQHDRGLALAWAYRDDLTERDLAHLIAFAGPRYPMPSPNAEQLAAWQRAVELAPERADVWFELGDRYFRGGREDSHSRAISALTRALELQPPDRRARRLLIMLAARREDTALLNRIVTPAALRDSMGALRDYMQWRVALARNDQATLTRIRRSFDTMNDQSLRYLTQTTIYDAVAIEDGERAAAIRAGRVRSSSMQLDALLELHALAMVEGQPQRALAITQQIEDRKLGFNAHLRLRILDALYGGGDAAAAAAAVAQLEPTVDGPMPDRSFSRTVRLANLCVVEQWRLAHGSTATVGRSIAALRDARPARRNVAVRTNPLSCAEILSATAAVVQRRPDALRRVVALDSLMFNGPTGGDAVNYSAIALGRLYQKLGHQREAMAAYRRRMYMTGWPRYIGTARFEVAQVAVALGDTTVAKSNFKRYYAILRNPEPQFAAARGEAPRSIVLPTAGRNK